MPTTRPSPPEAVPPDGSVTAAKVDPSLKPSGTAAASDEALRALGTTGSTACAGNDSRLSDTRTPTDGSVSNTKVTTGYQIPRVISNGSGTVTASSAVTLATVARAAGEVVWLAFFVEENIDGLGFANDLPNALDINVWLERTSQAHQVRVKAKNATATDRTVTWALLAVTP